MRRLGYITCRFLRLFFHFSSPLQKLKSLSDSIRSTFVNPQDLNCVTLLVSNESTVIPPHCLYIVPSQCDPPIKVHDLFQDVQDGHVLMALLEELSGCKLVRPPLQLLLSTNPFCFPSVVHLLLHNSLLGCFSCTALRSPPTVSSDSTTLPRFCPFWSKEM